MIVYLSWLLWRGSAHTFPLGGKVPSKARRMRGSTA